MHKGALKLLAPATITLAVVFSLATLLRLGLSLVFPTPSAFATFSPTPEPCGNVTSYTKNSNFSNEKVNINFESSDEQIDVSAGSGYEIKDIWLEVDGVNVQGYDLHFTSALNNYNPNPGGDIDEVKVDVRKVCASPSPSPSVSPSPIPSDDPKPSDDPVPTPTTGDVCTNLDGFQSSVPDGYLVNPESTECRAFQYGGPPPPPAAESTGQVLGASTLGSAGVFGTEAVNAGYLLGFVFSALGIMRYAPKKAKK